MIFCLVQLSIFNLSYLLVNFFLFLTELSFKMISDISKLIVDTGHPDQILQFGLLALLQEGHSTRVRFIDILLNWLEMVLNFLLFSINCTEVLALEVFGSRVNILLNATDPILDLFRDHWSLEIILEILRVFLFDLLVHTIPTDISHPTI